MVTGCTVLSGPTRTPSVQGVASVEPTDLRSVSISAIDTGSILEETAQPATRAIGQFLREGKSVKTPRHFSVRGAALAVAFVASSTMAQQRQTGQELTVNYGIVDRVDMVKVGSDGQPTGMATGAVVGGLAGSYNSTHGHQVRDAAAGALAGALLTAAIKAHKNKDNMAHQYTVNLLNGGTVSIVVEQGDIDPGDCVAVEQGSSANVRRVTPVHCANAKDATIQTAEVKVKRAEDATDCQVAKEAALGARTDAEIDVAIKKVRIFCES